MKRIFLAITLCLISTNLFSSQDSQAKRRKPAAGAAVAVTQNQYSIEPFLGLPSEIALNVPLKFVHTNRLLDMDDAKNLINLKRVSKSTYDLVQYTLNKDNTTVTTLSPLQRALVGNPANVAEHINALTPEQISTLIPAPLINEEMTDKQKADVLEKQARAKIALLRAIDAEPSDETKRTVCQKLNRAQFIPKSLNYKNQALPIIEGAVVRSNSDLFKEVQSLLKLNFIPITEPKKIGFTISTIPSPEQTALRDLAIKTYRQRYQQYHTAFNGMHHVACFNPTPEQSAIATIHRNAFEILRTTDPLNANRIASEVDEAVRSNK